MTTTVTVLIEHSYNQPLNSSNDFYSVGLGGSYKVPPNITDSTERSFKYCQPKNKGETYFVSKAQLKLRLPQHKH